MTSWPAAASRIVATACSADSTATPLMLSTSSNAATAPCESDPGCTVYTTARFGSACHSARPTRESAIGFGMVTVRESVGCSQSRVWASGAGVEAIARNSLAVVPSFRRRKAVFARRAAVEGSFCRVFEAVSVSSDVARCVGQRRAGRRRS